MNKIAIKLLILSIIVTVAIVLFLNKVMNKPSHLLELIPSSAVAVVKINTRDVAKDVYKHGGFTLDSIAFFQEDHPYFKQISDPRKTGINVYSELLLFQDKVKEQNYYCLLFNLNSLNNFKTFCATNSLLTVVSGTENTLFYSQKDSFYVWTKEKTAALLFHVQSQNHLVAIMDKINAQNPKEDKPFNTVLKKENNLVLWQKESNSLLQRDFPFMGEYGELYGDFIPGKFEYTGKTTKVIATQHTIFNPTFATAPQAATGTEYSGEITIKNNKIHPLAGVIRKWRSNR